MLKARIFTALVLLAAFLAALFYLREPYWSVLVLVITAGAAMEWGAFCRFSRAVSLSYGTATAALAALTVWVPGAGESGAGLLLLWIAVLFWALVVPLWLVRQWHLRSPFLLAVVGWVVLVPTALALVQLRGAGPRMVLAILALVWVADSAAYFAGRAWGRRKLAPAISPGKTWEGVAGALAGITAYGIALGALTAVGLWIVPAFWALTVLSIVGDLYESLMKRQAGLKDSGTLLPGHGGILDRIDSLTATLPAAALFVLYGPAPS